MKTENLILQSGVHTLRIDLYEEYNKKNVCRITCIDDDSCTEDEDGEYIEEHTEGCFYASVQQIDQIIEKLNEAKAFITC